MFLSNHFVQRARAHPHGQRRSTTATGWRRIVFPVGLVRVGQVKQRIAHSTDPNGRFRHASVRKVEVSCEETAAVRPGVRNVHIRGYFYAFPSPGAAKHHFPHLRLRRPSAFSKARVKAQGSLPPRAVQLVGVDDDGDGPVIDQLDLHMSAEDTGANVQTGPTQGFHELIEDRLADVPGRRR